MPLPTDPCTIFLGGLFLLAVMDTLYIAAALVLPIVAAIVLKLLLQPLVRVLDGIGVPRGLGVALGPTYCFFEHLRTVTIYVVFQDWPDLLQSIAATAIRPP